MEEEQDEDMKMVVRPRDVPFHKMKMPFMFLPYRIFVEWTNIADLVNDCLKLDKSATPNKIQTNPSTTSIDIHIRNIHRELHKGHWTLNGLDKLKFIYSTEPRIVTEASIFRWKKIKTERIYALATDFQRQFLFLPLPLLMHATNIRDLAVMLHTKRFPQKNITEEHLISIIDQMHGQIHKLNRWESGKMQELKFLCAGPERINRNVSVPLEKKRGRPKKCATKPQPPPAKSPPRYEPQPSTSRAYQSPPNDFTAFTNPQIHSTILTPQKSIDPHLSMDDDDDADQMSKRTRQRVRERNASKRAQSSADLAASPKKFKTAESNRTVTSNDSSPNRSERKSSNTSNNNTSKSDISGSVTHPKKAPRKALKRSQQNPSDKPTNVQCKVIQMDKNEFVQKTNIKELIHHNYGKMTKEEEQAEINHYFSLRFEWDDWEGWECLKTLALKEDLSFCELSDSGQYDVNLVDSVDDAGEATKPGTSSKLVGSSKNVKKVTSSSESTVRKSSKLDKFALTELQSALYKKLSPLSRKEFIKKTNIRQLILKEMEKHNAAPERFEQNMKKNLEKMFIVVQKPDQWHKFELIQKLEFVNNESDPGSGSKMNANNDDDKIPSSCEEKNDKSVQVEMSPINDDILSEVSEKGKESAPSGSSVPAISKSHHPKSNESSAQVLPSTSSHALRPSDIEANAIKTELPTEVSQNQSSITAQYNTQVQCGQKSNPKREHEIPETKSQSIDNNSVKDAAASDVIDESDVDMMELTAIPISTSTQKVQEKSLTDQETQFDESGNAENSFQTANNSDVICDGTRINLTIFLSESEDETQEDQQLSSAHSQPMQTSSANGAIQAEGSDNFTESLPFLLSISNPEIHIDKSQNLELSNNEHTDSPINDESTREIKPEPARKLPNSQAIDSDVICMGTFNEPIITIQDSDDEFMEMRELMNGTAIINGDSDSFGISNEPNNQEVEDDGMTVAELVLPMSGELLPTETVPAEVVFSTTTITTETTITVKGDSMMRPGPLECIENTINAKSLNQCPLSKRPIDKTSTKQTTNKRSKETMDDTLSNIQPPKYAYPPLQLINKQSNKAVRQTVGQKSTNVLSNRIFIDTDVDSTLCLSPQIDSDHGTPQTQASRCNIEEFDSSGGMNDSNGMNLERPQMESNTMKLLTQDNTWFANVNTQLITGNEQPSTSTQPITLSTVNIPLLPPITAKSTEKSMTEIVLVSTIPSHSRQDSTIQFLHYINIEKFESKLVIKAGKQSLHTNLLLKYQCNGRSKVNISGESVRFILDVTENEWNAVNQVLSTIGDFAFYLNSAPSHKSLLHRIIYYLFKTKLCFSKAHIAYNELDYETARALYNPYVIDNVDVTQAFDSQFLESVKCFRNRTDQG